MSTRTKIRALAIALSFVYTVVRVVIVQATLVSYGVNPWLFLVIDAITGVVYVLGIEQLIVASGKRGYPLRRLIVWSLLTAVAFAAPYVYLYMASRQLPSSLGIGLAVIVTLLVINAVLSFRRRVRQQHTR